MGEKKNKRTIWAWVNSSARRLSCDTLHSLCICRLSLMCSFYFLRNFHEPRGMLIHLDWSSLIAPGPYLMPTGLCHCRLQTALLPLPLPTLLSGFLYPTLSLAFPYPLPVMSKISILSPLIGFAPKQTKGSSA